MADRPDHSTDDRDRRRQVNDDLERLKQELLDLRLNLSLQLEAIDRKIQNLEEAVSDEAASTAETSSDDSPLPEAIAPAEPALSPEPDVPPEPEPVAPDTPVSPPPDVAASSPVAESSDHEPVRPDPPNPTRLQKQLYYQREEARSISNEFKELMSAQAMAFVLGPFSWAYDYLASTYNHFKKENKLSEFFLTSTGIIALLFGFGYLLQYSFVNYLGAAGRVGVGFAAGIGIIALGIRIIRRNAALADYGSSLVGLGITLNYLCIYFLTTYYSLTSPRIGFLIIVVNTIAAVFLSLRYETRIVAVVTLLGGAFAPAYLESTGESAPFYFSYLWMLCGASIFLARRIDWDRLGVLTCSVAFVIIETSLADFPNNMTWVGYSVTFHAFSYLFIFHALFKGLKAKETLRIEDITILTGTIALFLFNSFYVVDDQQVLGLIYLINAVPFLVAGLLPVLFSASQQIRALMIVFGGALIGFAIPALFSWELMGLFWAQEAIALVLCGFMFRFEMVRREGYLVGVVAVWRIVSGIPEIAAQWDAALLHFDYGNLFVLGGLLYGLKWLIGRYEEIAQAYENRFRTVLEEALSIWFAGIFFTTCFYYLDTWALNLGIIPLFLLVYRGGYKQLRVTECLGLACYAPLLIQIEFSVISVRSLHFTDQTLEGQVAIVEAFALLWIIQLYYERLLAEHRWVPVMQIVRGVFYFLLPFTLFLFTRRIMGDYSMVTWWGSLALNFVLLHALHHSPQRFSIFRLELYALAIVATWMSVQTAPFNTFGAPGYLATAAGVIVLSAILVYEQGYNRHRYRKSPFQGLISYTFYFIGMYIFFSIGLLFDALTPALFAAALYFLVLVVLRPYLPPLRQNFWLSYCLGHGLFILGSILNLVVHPSNMNTSQWMTIAIGFLNLLILYHLIYHPGSLYRSFAKSRNLMSWKMDLHLYHIYIMFAYVYGLAQTDTIDGTLVTIILVAHGIVLLFHTLKPQFDVLKRFSILLFTLAACKLVLYDLSDFSIPQKAVVTITLGVLLLAAAYGFRKLKLRLAT